MTADLARITHWIDEGYSLVASPMCPIGNPEMLSTSNFYDGNVIYVVWKDKLAKLQ